MKIAQLGVTSKTAPENPAVAPPFHETSAHCREWSLAKTIGLFDHMRSLITRSVVA